MFVTLVVNVLKSHYEDIDFENLNTLMVNVLKSMNLRSGYACKKRF